MTFFLFFISISITFLWRYALITYIYAVKLFFFNFLTQKNDDRS